MELILSPVAITIAVIVLLYSVYRILMDTTVVIHNFHKGVMIVSEYKDDTVVHKAYFTGKTYGDFDLETTNSFSFNDAGDDIVSNDTKTIISLIDERLESLEQVGSWKGIPIYKSKDYTFSFYKGVIVVMSNQ